MDTQYQLRLFKVKRDFERGERVRRRKISEPPGVLLTAPAVPRCPKRIESDAPFSRDDKQSLPQPRFAVHLSLEAKQLPRILKNYESGANTKSQQ